MLKSIYDLEKFSRFNINNGLILLVWQNHDQSDYFIKVIEKLAKLFESYIDFVEIADLKLFEYAKEVLNIQKVPTLWIVKHGKLCKILDSFDFHEYKNEMSMIFDENFDLTEKENLEVVIKNRKQIFLDKLKDKLNDSILTVVSSKNNNSEKFPYGTVFITSEELKSGVKEIFSVDYDEFIIVKSKTLLSGDSIDEYLNSADFKEITKELMNRLDDYIKSQVNKHECVIFMKGTKENPFCRFSKQIVQLFNKNNIDFDYFDVLKNLEVRERIKQLYNWKTFPQVYVKGELIGGNDVICEMLEEESDLKKALCL